jgi:hypothetical protein
MKLLKSRKFSDIFNDTFNLLKENGKHFFKNYFILNGLPLLFFLILIYFFTTTFYGLGTYKQGNTIDVFLSYMDDNVVLFTILGILSFIIVIIFGIIQYGFVPVYLILYKKNNGSDFDAKDMFNMIFKEKLGKIITYFFASFLVLILILIPFAIIAFASIFTIFGIFFVFAFVAVWFNNSLLEYLNSDRGIFNSFSYGYRLIMVRFWDYVGAIGLFFLMVTFISLGISMFTSILSVTLTTNAASNSEQSLFMTIAMIVSFILAKTINIFIQTVVQLAQGIVYFSAKEESENIVTKTEIDKIGLGE